MRVLILGSRGSLGSELMRIFADTDVTGWDKEEMDITNEVEVSSKILEFKPEVVFNCTGFTR